MKNAVIHEFSYSKKGQNMKDFAILPLQHKNIFICSLPLI